MRIRDTSRFQLQPLPDSDISWEVGTPYVYCTGVNIVIEYLAGDTRRKSHGGVEMVNVMPCAYGYIIGTTDVHGEGVDIYLADNADGNANVFVIDQIDPSTKIFDEHKVMIGFSGKEEIIQTYSQVFKDGSAISRIGAITQFTQTDFITWITREGSTLKPAYTTSVPKQFEMIAGVSQNHRAAAMMHAPRDAGGGVTVTTPDLSHGPTIVTKSNGDNGYAYHLNLFAPLNQTYWSNLIDVFCRILNLATEQDEMHIHIACPGGSVFLLGRMVSAIDATKAKVFTYAKGPVASAATAVWAAGHERHIYPGSFFMQHMSSQGLLGKTPSIAAKSAFCKAYIERQLDRLEKLGLFTNEEIAAMIDSEADVYINARTAIARVGAVSTGRLQSNTL